MAINQAVLTSLNTTHDELVKHLISDTRNIFSTMLGLELMHLPLEVDPLQHFNDCVSSMVGLAGTYNGLVAVHVPVSVATKIAGAMLDMEIDEVDQDTMDALGEIANMVAGNFKQHLSKSGHDVRLSTPSIATGRDYIISCKNSGSMDLLFDLNEEWMMISVLLELE